MEEIWHHPKSQPDDSGLRIFVVQDSLPPELVSASGSSTHHHTQGPVHPVDGGHPAPCGFPKLLQFP